MAGSDADQIKLENTQAKSEPNEVKFKLDQCDEEHLKQKLGETCFVDKSQVEVLIVGRLLKNVNSKHWAWLIRFKGDSLFEYATMEYTDNGIQLGLYASSLQMNMYQVCTTILGDSSTIEYSDEFETHQTWGDILKKCVHLRSVYTGSKYRLLGLNCRSFVRELGDFLTPRFGTSRFDQQYDFEFPHKLTNNSIIK